MSKKSMQFLKFPTNEFKSDGIHKVEDIMYVVKNGKPVGILYDNTTIVSFDLFIV